MTGLKSVNLRSCETCLKMQKGKERHHCRLWGCGKKVNFRVASVSQRQSKALKMCMKVFNRESCETSLKMQKGKERHHCRLWGAGKKVYFRVASASKRQNRNHFIAFSKTWPVRVLNRKRYIFFYIAAVRVQVFQMLVKLNEFIYKDIN